MYIYVGEDFFFFFTSEFLDHFHYVTYFIPKLIIKGNRAGREEKQQSEVRKKNK